MTTRDRAQTTQNAGPSIARDGRGSAASGDLAQTTDATPLSGLTQSALDAQAIARLHRGRGAARDVYRQVMRAGRFAPEDLGLSAHACQEWRQHFCLTLPEIVRVAEEEGPFGFTSKAVLRLEGGLEYECVRLPVGRHRHALCISSQVGCRLGCAFCETGRMGILRRLTAGEIVNQVLVARHLLGWQIDRIVFMGMGEPLEHVGTLLDTIAVLMDSAGLAFAQERLTVCTAGVAEGIRALRSAGLRRLNLSVSLNAANDGLRDRLMPLNRRTPLAELQSALAAYPMRRNFCLGVHYCLLPGINDSRQDARDIAAFCAPLGRVMIGLIPYNPGSEALSRSPTTDEIERFVGWLRDEGLPVRARVVKGRSVMAACGQLGNADLRRQLRSPMHVG